MALNTTIRGLQIADEFFGAGLIRNAVDGNIMDIKVDDSSIEIDTDTLQIKAGGVGTTQLSAGVNASLDLADSALQSIAEDSIGETELTDAVVASLALADSALQSVGADSITEAEIADDAVGAEHLNAGAETDGYVLTWNTGGTLTWTAKSSVAEDYIQEAEIQKATFAGDDSTVEFDVGDVPVANSVQVFLNGLLQEEGSGKDYTLATDKATFATAPITGDVVQIHSIKT